MLAIGTRHRRMDSRVRRKDNIIFNGCLMNKRLVWNFEIDPTPSLQLPESKGASSPEELRWESRYFWPENERITLHGLPEPFLELSRYRIKHKEDTYHLLENAEYNLKMRRDQLFYKPLLITEGNLYAYGKKINLAEYPTNTPLPQASEIDAATLAKRVQQESKPVQVIKEALIYRLLPDPKTKLELSWLRIAERTYFSVSVESTSQFLVKSLATQIVRSGKATNYVSFLKTL